MPSPSSSFIVSRANETTFVIQELDKHHEHPLIYAKIHPTAPIIILSDTGSDLPADEWKDSEFTRLRHLLEEYPVAENDGKPLNPNGEKTYVIILTHCHYDHINGIEQFRAGGTTQIIASAAGRDFIESDLPAHSLNKHMKQRTPDLKVTHWAQSYERLTWPLTKHMPGDDVPGESQLKHIDLGVEIIHTPGHTPDELAWVDIEERTIYVGDSFYLLGEDAEPIIFPPQGNLVDWSYSLQKIGDYIFYKLDKDSPPRALDEDDDWCLIAKPSRLSAAHTTVNRPAFEIMMQLVTFMDAVVKGKNPALYSDYRYGEVYTYWCSDLDKRDWQYGMALWCPQRLIDQTREYFGLPENDALPFSGRLLDQLKQATSRA